MGVIENENDLRKVKEEIEKKIYARLNEFQPVEVEFIDMKNNDFGHLLIKELLLLNEKHKLNRETFIIAIKDEMLKMFAKDVSPYEMVNFL